MSEKNRYEVLFDEFLNTIEFQLIKYSDGWGVEDQQGANLGSIEQDRFEDVMSLIDRLDIYTQDYFVKDIEEALGAGESSDWCDLLETAKKKLSSEKLKQCAYELEILDMICNHPEEIDLEKCCFIVRDECWAETQ